MFPRAEKYVNQWKGDYLLKDFLDKEGWLFILHHNSIDWLRCLNFGGFADF
jgi:hypothetical protein